MIVSFLFAAVALALQSVPSDQVPSEIHGFEGKSAARIAMGGVPVTGTGSYQLPDKAVQILWEWQPTDHGPYSIRLRQRPCLSTLLKFVRRGLDGWLSQGRDVRRQSSNFGILARL